MQAHTLGQPSERTATGVPHVAYEKGLLTIRAENCGLDDILRAVEKATGAAIESPREASEPISITLGPGRPAEIVSSLLNDSPYDYYIVVGPEPHSIARITLAVRSTGQGPSSSRAARAAASGTQGEAKAKASIDAQRLQEIQREQTQQFERMFGACIAQGCDQS